MSYVTQADIDKQPYSQEVAQLLDRNGDGTPDTGRLTLAIATADDFINGYLAGLYTTPLSPVPPMVVKYGCDLVRYFLWGAGRPEDADTGYKDAVAWLRDVAKGVVSLTSAGVEVAPSTALPILTSGRERTFTDTTLADYVGS